jgi:hypothetical protein
LHSCHVVAVALRHLVGVRSQLTFCWFYDVATASSPFPLSTGYVCSWPFLSSAHRKSSMTQPLEINLRRCST